MICVLAAGSLWALQGDAFTLTWTHSVERTEWREDWQAGPEGLRPVMAYIQGTGAGMELPSGARRVPGGWEYAVSVPPVPVAVLATSGATVGGWTLCAETLCRTLPESGGAPARLWWARADCVP